MSSADFKVQATEYHAGGAVSRASIQSKLIALFVSGLWLTVAAAEPDTGYKWEWTKWAGTTVTPYKAYALSVGAVGRVFSLIALLMARFKPEPLDHKAFTIKNLCTSSSSSFSFSGGASARASAPSTSPSLSPPTAT